MTTAKGGGDGGGGGGDGDDDDDDECGLPVKHTMHTKSKQYRVRRKAVLRRSLEVVEAVWLVSSAAANEIST